MVKKNNKTVKKSVSRKLIWIGGFALIVAAISYAVIMSSIPVNSKYPVFGAPTNHYLKAQMSKDGPVFVSASTRGGKGISGLRSGDQAPTIEVNVGDVVAIHMLNEDHQKHSLNIDQFNVHTKNLDYFESQSITFVADKLGRYTYYDSLHPEMTGIIVVGQ